MMAAERGALKNTLDAYRRDLKFLALELKNSVNDCNQAEIEMVLRTLSVQQSPRTIARKLSCYRQFFSFLIDENIRNDNPALRIPLPKIPQTLPQFLNAEQIRQMIDVLESKNTSASRRLLALISLLYATGLRVTEMLTLKRKAVQEMLQSQEPLLRVLGKGNKERIVPVTAQALKALRNYLVDCDPQALWLFPAKTKAGHLTRQHFARMLKQAGLEAGLDADALSPHVLRHSFATHLLKGGADLRLIQQLLGHSDISTTEIYTHIQPERMKALLEKHHPLAEKK